MSDTDENPSFLARVFGGRDSADAPEPETVAEASKDTMISAAEKFHVLRVEDVMVPRADIIAVAQTTTLKDLANSFEDASHSRLPVYGETLDEPVGMVHIKDVLPYLGFGQKARTRNSNKAFSEKKVIKTIVRPVLFVPPSMLAQDLLRRMQAKRVHMALVVDEYGGTDGLVTLEDLMEQIVGDIEDEHSDDDVEMLSVEDGKVWDVDARANIVDFEEKFGREIATDEQEDDVDTLGGLVFTLAGRVPERGEVIDHPFGIEFEVLDADARRVKRVRVRSKTLPNKDT